MMLRRAFSRQVFNRATGLLALGGVGYAGTAMYTDEAWRRSAIFWGHAFPIVIHYRYVQFKVDRDATMSTEEKAKRYSDLHKQYADKVLATILRLRGYYVKMGQIAAQFSEMMPKEWLENLRSLEDCVPPEPFSRVRAIVEADFNGQSLYDIFDKFEETPIGSASIGQAHRATLKDGRQVVVKVMYPDVERFVRGDMKTLRRFCEIADPVDLPSFDEMEKQFLFEFDYRKEAQNQLDVRNSFHNSVGKHWLKKVYIPQVHQELCTKNVLVMEYVPGDKLMKAVNKRFEAIAAQYGMTLAELEEKYMSNPELQEEPGESSALTMWAYWTLVRSRDLTWNSIAFFMNYTFGFLFRVLGSPSHRIIHYKHTELPLDSRALIHTLIDVHGHEVFHGGIFNSDPHAGNVLLMPDGRLGLIDYGQVKRLAKSDRAKFARLIVALADKDSAEIVRVYTDMGFRTEKMTPKAIEESAILYFDAISDELLQGADPIKYFEELYKSDPVENMPDEFVMVSRAALILHGLSAAMGCETGIASRWRPFAEEFLRDYKSM